MSKERKDEKHPSREKEQHGKEIKHGQPPKNKPSGHNPGCSCSSCK